MGIGGVGGASVVASKGALVVGTYREARLEKGCLEAVERLAAVLISYGY
jgi:hypothetical protein